jgi:hypothetical protein
VDFLLTQGLMLSQLMPQYNIIGFDPRGVNNSGPALTCFGEDEASRAIENEYSTQFIRSVDGKSERSMRYQFAASTAFGKWCTKFNENTHAKYASTVAVAQDMAHYTKMVAKASGKDPKQAKLNYYGKLPSHPWSLKYTYVNSLARRKLWYRIRRHFRFTIPYSFGTICS